MTIITICTENYRDAIDFMLPSWLRYADKVVMFTDFKYSHPDSRVHIHNTIKKTDDWLKIVGMKAVILKEFLKRHSDTEFVFLDIDCYLAGDISEVFSNDFDVAATRMFDRKVANSGVWFCKRGEGLDRFADQWVRLQEDFKRKGIGVIRHVSSYSQRAFSYVLHNDHSIKVLPLDKNIYNSEGDDPARWIGDVRYYGPKVLHFKGRKWRDAEVVKALI